MTTVLYSRGVAIRRKVLFTRRTDEALRETWRVCQDGFANASVCASTHRARMRSRTSSGKDRRVMAMGREHGGEVRGRCGNACLAEGMEIYIVASIKVTTLGVLPDFRIGYCP